MKGELAQLLLRAVVAMNELNIQLSHIQKSYARPVLIDVNLHVVQGDFISVIGESGSGKSTLLNLLGLVEMFDGGEYLFNGVPINAYNHYGKLRRENIGFIFQNYNLIPSLTCLENILLPCMYSKKRTSNRLNEIVNLIGISHLLDQRVNILSGGEKQRVAIARSLMLDPGLLLADEPTGNLDPENRDIILKLLKHENNIGRSIIMITHDITVAAQGKKILMLKEGCLHEMA